jgi:hypothetical protein
MPTTTGYSGRSCRSGVSGEGAASADSDLVRGLATDVARIGGA